MNVVGLVVDVVEVVVCLLLIVVDVLLRGLLVDGVELNRSFLNSPFPLVSEVTKAFAKGKIQAFLPLNSFGRILIRITMHSVPKHEIWFKKFLDSMFNFAHYINPDKKCLKK